MQLKNKTALITGATGQDSSYLIELLLEKHYNVVGIARRVSVDTTERIAHLIGLPGFTLECGDVSDPICMYNLIKKHQPDEIYNLAAQSHVGVSFENPHSTFQITAGGCLNLLDAIKSLRSSDYDRTILLAMTLSIGLYTLISYQTHC